MVSPERSSVLAVPRSWDWLASEYGWRARVAPFRNRVSIGAITAPLTEPDARKNNRQHRYRKRARDRLASFLFALGARAGRRRSPFCCPVRSPSWGAPSRLRARPGASASRCRHSAGRRPNLACRSGGRSWITSALASHSSSSVRICAYRRLRWSAIKEACVFSVGPPSNHCRKNVGRFEVETRDQAILVLGRRTIEPCSRDDEHCR